MAVEYEHALALKKELEEDYRTRHDAFRNLRRYWHGGYWQVADAEQKSIVSIFRDLTQRSSDVGPDVKLVHNVVQMVCVKYQTFLSPLPQIRVYPDPPETDRRRAQATVKERYLYGTWAMGQMDKVNANVGWYLPLMGDCFHGIWPDFDSKTPLPILRSPENAYPVVGIDGQEEAFIFAWKLRESQIKRAYPDYVTRDERRSRLGRLVKAGTKSDPDPILELVEYSDDNCFQRWVDGQLINGVEHNFGWNLFEHMKFISVPDEVWGHGAVEQAINLNEMGNALYSLMFQSVLENVFPRLVLIDPAMAPEEIETGPGAVIPINAGGSVEWLHPPVQAIGMQEQFSRLNQANILEQSGMAGVNFGQSPASSIVTGKAVNELEGASTGSTIEMVQGIGIGDGLVAWNEKALSIGQNMFADDTINLYGLAPKTGYDLVPAKFSLSLKGKQLIGGTRNEVTFQPAISQHEKLVMWLQAKGGGLVSNQFIRNQIGIPDSEAMDEEMFAEAVDQGVLGAILNAFMAQPEAGNVEDVEQQAAGLLAGATPAPHPLLAASAPPGTLPGGPAGASPSSPPRTKQATAGSALPQAPAGPATPQGPPPPGQGASPAAAPGSPAGGPIPLDQVVSAIQSLRDLQGRVFVVGEIVQTGQTDGEVEIALTVKTDQDSLSKLGIPMSFHLIAGEPNEPFVEVTPGKAPRQGGGAEPQQQAA